MQDDPGDTSRYVLIALYAVWLIVFVYSFFAYAHAPYEGAGFPDGLNKGAVFLGWQGIAAMLALSIWGVGRGWPPGSGTRRISAIPLLPPVLVLMALLGVFAWA